MTTLAAASTDSLTMLRRSIRHTLRSPDTMILAIALPVILLLLFVYVFGGAMNVGTDYLNYVVPGIILLCAGFGASTIATSISADMTEGIVDRFRTMAISQRAVLTGHVGASLLRNLATTAIVVAVAVLMGFRPSAGPLEYLAAIGVVALFVLAISWLCVALGLLAANPEAASGFTFFLLFLPYMSSAFVPPESMPSWLRGFAEHQPVTPVIETLRGLLTGTPIGSSALLAVCWCLTITAFGYAWARAAFRRKTLH